VTCSLAVSWDDRLTSYDFGPGHPLAPVRVELTMALAREFGLLDGPGVSMITPEAASPDLLELIHDPVYLDAVRRAGDLAARGEPLDPRSVFFGLGTADDPVFPHMHEASSLVVGATLAAAQAVWTSAAQHGISVAGGLHHAMRRAASGFCVYNDPAIAIAWLLDQGLDRIAYVDLDVHHGDGVQAAFYSDPRVLTISLHEDPATLWPQTGRSSETGAGAGEGYAVNIPVPAGTGDRGWLRAFDAVVPPLLRSFQPQLLVSQHGCDTHLLDPLANLEVTVDGQRRAQSMVHELAHETAGGRWLCTGGGGYALAAVVPRSWTHLLGIAGGRPVDRAEPTPAAWRELVRRRTGTEPPELMTDGGPDDFTPFETGFDPADPVDRSIMATRNAVFPAHGLFAGL
jgi:acetoin utilization protein AcuC